MNPTTRANAPTIRLAIGAAAALALLTRPLLPALPLSHVDRLGAFLQLNGAVVTAASGLRLLATIAAAYVLLIALLALLVTIGKPSPTAARVVRAITLPMLRVALPSVFGFCLLAVPAGAQSAPGLAHRSIRAHDHAASVHTATTIVAASPNHGDSRDDLVLLDAPRTPTAISGSDRPSTTRRSTDTVAGGDEVATFRVEPPDPRSETIPSTTLPAAATTRSVPITRRRSRRPTTPPTSRPRTSGTRHRPPPSRRSSVVPPTSSGASSLHATPNSPPGAPATNPNSATAVATQTASPAVAVTPPDVRATIRSAGPAVGERTWTTRPGDHLWRIAHETVAARVGRPPTDAEVTPYWQQLIQTNRSRLVDPNNPDLIFPGQVFTLP